MEGISATVPLSSFVFSSLFSITRPKWKTDNSDKERNNKGETKMTYASYDEFKKDVKDCEKYYNPEIVGRSLETAWKVYNAAQNTNLKLLLVGRIVKPDNTQDTPGIDQYAKDNFFIMNEIDTGGSILNSTNWTLLVNDAWVLGGVHKRIDFYLASPRVRNNLYDTKAKRMTVTARELAGLKTFGYRLISHPQLGEVAVSESDTANFATLLKYNQQLDTLNTEDKVISYVGVKEPRPGL